MNNEQRREKLIERVRAANVDVGSILLKGFSCYKRKRNSHDQRVDTLVTDLISLYYDIGYKDVHFDNMKKSFVRKYILNESRIEGVNDLTLHGKEEMEGLRKMYEYMHSEEIENRFDVFTLKTLHEKLFSCSPYPEFGGNFRTTFAYLYGSRADICDARQIFFKLRELNPIIFKLREISPLLQKTHHSKDILRYLDECSRLSCKLIKIHPFTDGNGRTVRCFINKLMEDATLPSVYVKTQDRSRYLEAMRKGIEEDDYSDMAIFYRYKVCDSILELDMNERLREKREQSKIKVFTKVEEER